MERFRRDPGGLPRRKPYLFKIMVWAVAFIFLSVLLRGKQAISSIANAAPISTNLVDTTTSDFSQCGVANGLTVANEAGGELRLASTFEDYFDNPTLSASWSSGTWNGGTYVPAPSGGVLPVPAQSTGAWARSTSTFSQQALTARINFGAGPWEHVGWADNGFGTAFAILSTFNAGSSIYARTYINGTELRTQLPGVSLNSYHDVQIVWGPNKVDYYVDGVVVATHSATIVTPMFVYLSNNSSAASLNVDDVRVESYPVTAATLVSCVKDAGVVGPWGQLSWSGTLTGGTNVAFQTRSSVDNVTWSPWSDVVNGQIASPDGRFVQYQAALSSVSSASSPRIDQVTVFSILGGPTMTATSTFTSTSSPSSTASQTPTPTSTVPFTSTPTATATSVLLMGDKTIEARADSSTSGRAEAFQFTSVGSGSATRVWVYVDTGNAATQIVVGLYANSGSNIPNALLAQATIASPISASWNSVAIGATSLTAGQSYWIAVLSPSGRGTVRFRDVTTGGRSQLSSQSTLSALPATWSAGTSSSHAPISAYVVQDVFSTTPTSTPTLTPSPTFSPTATITATISSTSTPTSTIALMLSPTGITTDSPTATPTLPVLATDTATDVPTVTPTDAATGSPTDTPSVTPTDVAEAPTATTNPTDTQTSTPMGTATPSFTPTATTTGTATSTNSATNAPTSTATFVPTSTATVVSTSTATSVPTSTPTATFTRTATPTVSAALTSTTTPAASGTPFLLVGDQNVEIGHDNNPSGIAEAFQYTAATTGSANKLSIFLDSANAATQVIVGIYADTGSNDPGALLTQASISNPIAGTWNSIATNPTGLTAGQKYWIVVLSPAGKGTVQYRDVAPGSRAEASVQTTLTTLPTTWSPGPVYLNAPMSAFAVHDSSSSTTPPVISGVDAINVTDSGATITWSTDEVANSQVDYGPTIAYGSSTAVNQTMVSTHSQTLIGLPANTIMHYRVRSTDLNGNSAVSGDFSFTTPAVTPPTNPIVVVVDPASSNPFGKYVGEILRAEGINSFQVVAPSNLTAAYLANFSTVILTQASLSASQTTLYTGYVSNGGTLIALRPDSSLAAMLGLSPAGGTTTDGYLLASSGNPVGAGIANQTIQFHGVADNYNLSGATVVATMYSNATTATNFPAIVMNTYGSGRAAAFTYDLAQSVAYTRQGNPAFANIDKDGDDGVIRSVENFVGYLDVNRGQIPQADEQMRILSNLITYFGQQTVPIPRIWYFPNANQPSIVVMTGDDHGQVDSAFRNMAADAQQYGGHMSFYLSRFGFLTSATELTLQNAGSEFGIHPFGQADNQSLTQGFTAARSWFLNTYGRSPSDTVRTHQLQWQDWATGATIEQQYNIGMDTSFYWWGPTLKNSSNQLVCTGYMTGSGLPMKFVDTAGNIIPVYQQTTELVDEQMIAGASFGYCGLNQSQALTQSQQFIDQAVAGYYEPVTVQAHTDYYAENLTVSWFQGLLAYAQSKGLPIWTTTRWLNFTHARHDAVVDQFNWNAGARQLSFRFTSSIAEPSASTMVPASYNGFAISSVTVDGAVVSTTAMNVKGFSYAGIAVPAGAHTVVVIYGPPASPTSTPTITPTSPPTSTPTRTPTFTPTSTSSPTATPCLSCSPTFTATSTMTPTIANTATASPTSTSIPSATKSATPTAGLTVTPTVTATPVPLVGDRNVEANGDNNPSGVAEAFQYTASAGGTANQLALYVDGNSTATKIVVGIYTSVTGNHPGTLLAQATITSPVNGAWNTIGISSTAITSGGAYWIAVLGPTGTAQFRDVATGGKCETSSQSNLATLPATWSTGAAYFNAPMSAYAIP